jgi:hypothetical protein
MSTPRILLGFDIDITKLKGATMMNHMKLIGEIKTALDEDIPEYVISPFLYEQATKNQLLFFFKPECFFLEFQKTRNLLEMVFEKFDQFRVEISGSLLLYGRRLEELSIMDRHYGFINRLSKKASKIISTKELEKIQLALGIDKPADYQLLGGHECLNQYQEFDEKSLDGLWLTQKSIKLRSGFYFHQYKIKGKKVIMVNGFHPSQLRHYTDPLHKIIVLLVHSNTEWNILKNDLAGDTFPERAKENSIRGEIFRNNSKYGIQNPTISNNCIHLSAGPFEALFEIDNFLQRVEGAKFNLDQTNISRLMNEVGLEKREIKRCLSNPTAKINSTSTDLFTLTEEKNSTEAISMYRNYFLL